MSKPPGKTQTNGTSAAPIPPAIQTAYLRQLKVRHRVRAHAAMRWRPRLLKALAMGCGYILATKAARVSYNTVRAHERNDPEFAAQLRDAEQEGAQLLHDVCWKAAVQGKLEPVYWQGQIVDWVRKFDSRLQIEFLRAYMPDKFKTPGAKVNVSTGNQPVAGNAFVIDSPAMLRLQAMRQESLKRIEERMAKGREVPPNGGTAPLGTGPLPPVPPAT